MWCYSALVPEFQKVLDLFLATPHGEQAYAVVEKLTDAGFDTWWVGGGVRDLCLGRIPTEIDIGTEARPDQVREIFPKHDAAGAAYGSVVVLLKGQRIEVTTFREDDEASDGRHPESVVFGTRQEDSVRRDFTVNAIYYHPLTRQVWDPHDGQAHLRMSLIAVIGDPVTRIRHDALRILRAVRFRAHLGFQYHPDTYQALREHPQLVEVLSGTRVAEELAKILHCADPARALEDLFELQILPYLLPELAALKGLAQPVQYHREGDTWEHVLRITRAFRPEDPAVVRVAALLHDIGKARTFSLEERIRFDHHATVSAEMAEGVLKRLQVPHLEREEVVWLIRHHMMLGTTLTMNEKRCAHWYYHPWFPHLLRVFWLDIAGTEPSDFRRYEEVERHYHQFLDTHPRPPKPLVSGDEVMAILGIGPGERVGEIMSELYERQMCREITTKTEAREFLVKRSGAER